MVACCDEQDGSCVGADAVEGEQARGTRGDEGDDELVEPVDLVVKELCTTSKLSQSDTGGVADDLTWTGTQRCELGDQTSSGVLGEAGMDVIGASDHKGSGLIDRPGSLASGGALRNHQGSDRLDAPVPSFWRALGPAGQGGAGCAHRVERVGLALAATFGSVSAVHFDDPDVGGSHVAGGAGAVAAGSFDPDHANGPEAAEPFEQAGVAGWGSRELFGPEQSSDAVEYGGDVHVGVRVHTAGDGACLYDGQSRPFLWLRGGTHPLRTDL